MSHLTNPNASPAPSTRVGPTWPVKLASWLVAASVFIIAPTTAWATPSEGDDTNTTSDSEPTVTVTATPQPTVTVTETKEVEHTITPSVTLTPRGDKVRPAQLTLFFDTNRHLDDDFGQWDVKVEKPKWADDFSLELAYLRRAYPYKSDDELRKIFAPSIDSSDLPPDHGTTSGNSIVLNAFVTNSTPVVVKVGYKSTQDRVIVDASCGYDRAGVRRNVDIGPEAFTVSLAGNERVECNLTSKAKSELKGNDLKKLTEDQKAKDAGGFEMHPEYILVGAGIIILAIIVWAVIYNRRIKSRGAKP